MMSIGLTNIIGSFTSCYVATGIILLSNYIHNSQLIQRDENNKIGVVRSFMLIKLFANAALNFYDDKLINLAVEINQ